MDHEHIAHSLGQIEGKVDGINGRLDKLNGSVARHEARIANLEQWMWRCIGAAGALMGAASVIAFAIQRWAK